MGSCHGRAGPPIELQALPEAWGEGNRRKQIPETAASQSPAKEKVIPLEAEDIKIESVEEVDTKENPSVEKDSESINSSIPNKIDMFDGIKTPAEVSVTSRRTMTKSVSPRTKSDGSSSWNGSIENEGSGHLSVTSYNLIRTVRSGCRASKSLLDYSDMMFKDLLKKLELMHTNTRMRFKHDFEMREKKNKEQFTDITNEIKELKQTVEKQNKLLEIQQLNVQSSENRFTRTVASSHHVTEKAPHKVGSRALSRAATQLVRPHHRAVSSCAPAPTTTPSRIPVAVRNGSRTFDSTKSATGGNYRNPPEQQQQQAMWDWSISLMKRRYHAGTGTVRKNEQKHPSRAKEKQINIQEHKKGPKLAQYR